MKFLKKLFNSNKESKTGFVAKWILLISSLLLVVNLLLGVVLTVQYRAAIRTQLNERMLDIANSAAALLDGNKVGNLTVQDKNSPDYTEAEKILSSFQDNIELEHIFSIRIVSEREFVYAIDPSADEPKQFGEALPYSEAMFYASKGYAGLDKATFESSHGQVFRAYSPVRDSSDRVVWIVGVDFNTNWYETQVARSIVSVLIICILSLMAGLLVVFFISAGLRKRFIGLHRELNLVEDNVNALTDEITNRPGYKPAQLTEGLDSEDADPNEKDEKKKKPLDSIDILTEKMHSMQAELRRYISFAHELAYTDTPTGVGNKTAYIERVHAIERQIAQGNADFSIVVFDINGLKTVNDNYGHEYGDMIIADSALVMMRVCKRNRVFRIGGDEFIALLEGFSAWETETLFANLDKTLAAFNANEKTYEMTLSFSKGAATFRPGEDKNYQAVFKRADEAMYADKAQYYRQFGDRRRRIEFPPEDASGD